MQVIFFIIRFLVVAGGSLYISVLNIDLFLNPKYGSNNLMIASAILIFIPLFLFLFVELSLRGYKKRNKKRKNIKKK